MDFDDALAVFGLNRATHWDDVRSRYRDAMRREHPDLVHGDGETARVLNDAFAVLEPVFRRGHPAPAPRIAVVADPPAQPGPPGEPVSVGEPAIEVVLDDDGLALIAPADEVFARLFDALGAFGQVMVADPDGKYLEVALAADAGTLSVSLQGRNSATEAFFTLETPPGRPPVHLADLVRVIAQRFRS